MTSCACSASRSPVGGLIARGFGSLSSIALIALSPHVLLAQSEPPTASGVQVDVTEQYYTLEEPTLSEVISRLNSTRLQGESGPLSQGLTDWWIQPEWRPGVAGGRCRVTALTLSVRVVVTLPEWRHARRAPAQERMRWGRIEAAIRDHEYTHRDLTVEAAERLHARLSTLEARGCSALHRAFQGEMSVADARLSESHAELDRATPDRLIGAW